MYLFSFPFAFFSVDFFDITEMGEAEALPNNEQALQAESAVVINKDPVDVDPTFRFHSKAPTGQFDKFVDKIKLKLQQLSTFK